MINGLSAKDIISHLELNPHPEGGFYKETYRSDGSIGEKSLPENMKGSRTYATSIYYLLRTQDSSAFHRIKSDEIWHFHGGDPLEIFEIDEDGNLVVTILGSNILDNEKLSYIVVANRWFAARPANSSNTAGYSLVSCGVAPGFDPQDFEMADLNDVKPVIDQNPSLADLIIQHN